MTRREETFGLKRAARLIWAVIGLQSLTYCSGSSVSSNKDPGDGSGSTLGYSGHTGHCFGPDGKMRCGGGGCMPCGGNGGNAGDGGSAGNAGNAGNAGDGGKGGVSAFGGFAGHTAGCLNNCGAPGCQPCLGGSTGDGGDNQGGAPEGGAAGEGPAKQARSRSGLACYTLSGYENDPCLPADDAVLPWLGDVPTCDVTVIGGPISADARRCCYSVACRSLE